MAMATGWDYYADGKPQQIRTWNIGVPVPIRWRRETSTHAEARPAQDRTDRGASVYTFSVEHGYNAMASKLC